ncbi:MAG: reverse transcriptase domain-containing protein [Pseudomonadota bacterium]
MNAFRKATSVVQLREAWRSKSKKLRASCFGVDRISASTFEEKLERNIRALHRDLIDVEQPYKSSGLLAIAKRKPNSTKYRIICVPTLSDRLVQFSILQELKPKLQAMGIDNSVSYGIAEGRDKSVIGARVFACSARSKHPWVYKTDIQQFFDNLERDRLREALSRVVKQPTLLPLIEKFIDTEITDGFDKRWRQIAVENGIVWGKGVRQGMPLSPLLAGAYLRDFDRQLAKSGVPVARYVDDIVAFFDTEAEAKGFHARISDALAAIGLNIGEPNVSGSKTTITAPSQPAEFLGMEIAYKPGGGYRLQVSKTCIADAAQKLRDAGQIDYLLEKRISLTSMGRYFESVIQGYLNAYDAANNRDDLRIAITTAADTAQANVLKDLFGKKKLQSLNDKQLRFVGINGRQLLS